MIRNLLSSYRYFGYCILDAERKMNELTNIDISYINAQIYKDLRNKQNHYLLKFELLKQIIIER